MKIFYDKTDETGTFDCHIILAYCPFCGKKIEHIMLGE